MGLFPGGKAVGERRRQDNPSNAEVKQTVELYLYSSSEPSWPLLYTGNQLNGRLSLRTVVRGFQIFPSSFQQVTLRFFLSVQE